MSKTIVISSDMSEEEIKRVWDIKIDEAIKSGLSYPGMSFPKWEIEKAGGINELIKYLIETKELIIDGIYNDEDELHGLTYEIVINNECEGEEDE